MYSILVTILLIALHLQQSDSYSALFPRVCKNYRCYYLSKGINNHDGAVRACKRYGFRLVQIESNEANNFVYNYVRKWTRGHYWIEGTDRHVEGDWRLPGGVHMKYSLWHRGEPNNVHNEDCIEGAFFWHSNRWNDISCYDRQRFVCEQVLKELHPNLYCHDGKCYQVSLNRRNFNDAANICRKFGMQLPIVADTKTNNFLSDTVRKFHKAEYWINGQDRSYEKLWLTEGKIPLRLFYFNWYRNEPNNWRNNEDCIEVGHFNHAPRFWNDLACNELNYYACEKTMNALKSTKHCSKDSCYRLSNSLATHSEAVQICAKAGFKLASIDCPIENEFVLNLHMKHNGLAYLIDGSDAKQEGVWHFADGRKANYLNWMQHEPNGGRRENCLEVRRDGSWIDGRCSDKKPFLCEQEKLIKLMPPACKDHKCYSLSTGFATQAEAASNCARRGLRLVQIETAAANDFVYSYVRKYTKRNYWIDGTDRAYESDWKFSNGAHMKYALWHRREPNNANNEDCIMVGFFGQKTWNDFSCSKRLLFVCERVTKEMHPKPYCANGKCYHVSLNRRTFKSAVKSCKKMGMDLAIVTSAHENKFIADSVSKHYSAEYWINGQDETHEGIFHIDNNRIRLNYFNWFKGEPNNLNNEDCIEVGHQTRTSWNDIPCNVVNYYVCEKIHSDLKPHKKCSSSKCYRLSNRLATYYQAKFICAKNNMRLARIESSWENSFVLNYHKTNSFVIYYIDGNDLKREKYWVFSDGSRMKYFAWMRGEPNGGRRENCLEVRANGQWIDGYCHTPKPFVCEVKKEIKLFPEKCFGSRCVAVSNGRTNMANAKKICAKHGMQLVQIDSWQFNELVFKYAWNYVKTKFYVDGDDLKREGTWKFSNEAPIRFSKWNTASNEPNNYANQDCLEVGYFKNSNWNDIGCNYNQPFVCERYLKYLHEKPSCYEGKSYYVSFKQLTYTEADKYCKSKNMQLAISMSENTNKFIYHSARKYGNCPFYINGQYRANTWMTNEGQYLLYSNWHRGEPNNMRTELCVELNRFSWDPSKWNNIRCNVRNTFVCEKMKTELRTTPKNSATKFYKVSNKFSTFHEAIKICNQNGLRLAQIENAQEAKFVHDMMKDMSFLHYWIDASDENREGSWKQKDYTSISYKNWNRGEPNGWRRENCAEVISSGKWNDVPCNFKRVFVCEKPEKILKEEEKCLTPTKCYKFSKGKVTQPEAVAICKKFGYRLVQINHANENAQIVRHLLSKFNERVWIDGKYLKKSWKFANGADMRYRNWGKYQPNLAGNFEKCLKADRNGFYVSKCTSLKYFVCEKLRKEWFDKKCNDEKCYHISTRHVDYKTAKNICQRNKLRMVRIETEEENNLVFDFVRAVSIKEFWINGVEVKKQWQYNNNDKIEFTNWHKFEPSGSFGNENCIEVGRYSTKDEDWNDQNCATKNLFVCEKVLKKIVKNDPLDCKKTSLKCVDQVRCVDNYCFCKINAKLRITKMWLRTSLDNYVSGLNGCGAYASCKAKNAYVHKCVCNPGFIGNGFRCKREAKEFKVKCGENAYLKNGVCVCQKNHSLDEFNQNCEPIKMSKKCGFLI